MDKYFRRRCCRYCSKNSYYHEHHTAFSFEILYILQQKHLLHEHHTTFSSEMLYVVQQKQLLSRTSYNSFVGDSIRSAAKAAIITNIIQQFRRRFYTYYRLLNKPYHLSTKPSTPLYKRIQMAVIVIRVTLA